MLLVTQKGNNMPKNSVGKKVMTSTERVKKWRKKGSPITVTLSKKARDNLDYLRSKREMSINEYINHFLESAKDLGTFYGKNVFVFFEPLEEWLPGKVVDCSKSDNKYIYKVDIPEKKLPYNCGAGSLRIDNEKNRIKCNVRYTNFIDAEESYYEEGNHLIRNNILKRNERAREEMND